MTFTFNGLAVSSQEGETIAAALIRAGFRSGYFCGIGVCFGCLVTVNGSPAQRACLTPVSPSTDIVQPAVLSLPAPPSPQGAADSLPPAPSPSPAGEAGSDAHSLPRGEADSGAL